MHKLTQAILWFFCLATAYAQQDLIILKKHRKSVTKYWKGGPFAFQLSNKQWQKGEITKINNDSFFIKPMIVRYSPLGTDTTYFNVQGYAITDVYAVPKKGVLIDYSNGMLDVSRSGGHERLYWIKSGWILRVGAVGYAGLHLANGLIYNKLSLADSKTPLITAAAVYLAGVLLKKSYKPHLRIGRKYRLEILKFANSEKP